MREIKFRVGDSRYIEDGWSEYDIYELFNLSVVSFSNNDYKIVRQYTGLKDKNSVEIYEGDIIRTGDGKYTGLVEYERPAYVFNRYRGGRKLSQGIGVFYTGIEVIGNIYENPELLS